MRDRLAEGEEWNCITCGSVDYGDGFEALDDPALTVAGTKRINRRGASHAGTRL